MVTGGCEKGSKKRMSRHMQQLGCRSVNAYLHILERNEGIRQQCEGFNDSFRKPLFFVTVCFGKVIEDQIVPENST